MFQHPSLAGPVSSLPTSFSTAATAATAATATSAPAAAASGGRLIPAVHFPLPFPFFQVEAHIVPSRRPLRYGIHF